VRPVLIRHAQPDANTDGAAGVAIYAPFVEHTSVSSESTPPDGSEFARRIERLPATHASLVAEDERGVAGFARQGMWTALAGVALPNPGSVALRESCGFEPIGV
jgi:L-amino acid N-acyltransferase YncA